MTGPSIVLVIASVLALWHPCPVTAREGFRQSADDRGPVSQSVEARIAGAASREKAGIPCTAADSQNGEPTAPIIVAVNRATFEELQSLPGIGPRKAQALLDARARRPFKRPSDLRRVKGFGAKTVQRLAPSLVFD